MAQTPISLSKAGFARDAGVTLVEMAIAILVVSLLSGLVLLAAPGPERKMRGFVERFAAIVARGGEESVMVNAPVALVIENARFGFRTQDGDRWIDHAPGASLGFRPWPDGVRVDVVSPRQADVVTVFDPLGAATPAELHLSKGASAWRVRVNANGSVDVLQLE